MVGSGAVACELLKNFAVMGVALTEKHGDVYVTDDDFISPSNLHRQFLFRSHHVNKMKSEVAAQSIKQMNSSVEIKPYVPFT